MIAIMAEYSEWMSGNSAADATEIVHRTKARWLDILRSDFHFRKTLHSGSQIGGGPNLLLPHIMGPI